MLGALSPLCYIAQTAARQQRQQLSAYLYYTVQHLASCACITTAASQVALPFVPAPSRTCLARACLRGPAGPFASSCHRDQQLCLIHRRKAAAGSCSSFPSNQKHVSANQPSFTSFCTLVCPCEPLQQPGPGNGEPSMARIVVKWLRAGRLGRARRFLSPNRDNACHFHPCHPQGWIFTLCHQIS